MNKLAQLTLPLTLPDDETFASFYAGENASLVVAIQGYIHQLNEGAIYFWSEESAGRSHLLHAACTEITSKGGSAGYIPLEYCQNMSPELLEGMEQLSLICLDNMHAIAGNKVWQMAIFNLYNRILETGKARLLMTGNGTPRELGLTLPDLASRLDWGLVYRLKPLSDEEKLLALRLRAELRGFELPEDVGRFLLKRLDRQMRNLFAMLDRLDHASMTAQRKLTIPFVKHTLDL